MSILAPTPPSDKAICTEVSYADPLESLLPRTRPSVALRRARDACQGHAAITPDEPGSYDPWGRCCHDVFALVPRSR